jgi:hypothetical protein
MGLVITRTIKLLGLAMLLGMLASTPGYAQSGDAIRQGVQIGTAIPPQARRSRPDQSGSGLRDNEEEPGPDPDLLPFAILVTLLR